MMTAMATKQIEVGDVVDNCGRVGVVESATMHWLDMRGLTWQSDQTWQAGRTHCKQAAARFVLRAASGYTAEEKEDTDAVLAFFRS